jgi:acyl-CoA thioesterase I
MKAFFSILIIAFISLTSCSSDNVMVTNNNNQPVGNENTNTPKNFNYLALGDSYTIGQSVCETCRFPIQLQESLKKNLNVNDVFNTQIIATTGWTTSNLKNAISSQNPSNNNDLVTLLIGVNNQYQNRPFSLYEEEFPQLVTTAIALAKGQSSRVIVVSIPDYAYTPYGQSTNNQYTISTQLNNYNSFAENYCQANNITFVNITDITRLGLQQPELVASDGLHPSAIAYRKFVERLLPIALEKIQ